MTIIIRLYDGDYNHVQNAKIFLYEKHLMQINIESPHLEFSQTLKHKIEHKLLYVQKLYDRITSCDITLFKEKDDQQNNCSIQAKLLLPQHELFVKEHAENFDKALYQVTKNLLRQLREYKQMFQEAR